MTEWQPIETAPKEIVWKDDQSEYGKHILVGPYHGEVVRARWWQWRTNGEITASNFIIDGGHAARPTHWMPLPSLPTESEAITRDEPRKPSAAFAARLAERVAELEAERDKMHVLQRPVINGQIGLIQAIAHDYSEVTK
jgi:hypothetical protein